MKTVRSISTGLMFLLASVYSAAAAGLASDWVEGFNNKSRLLAGRTADGKLVAGLQISMPSGWKTYWRAPGDAGGVPPEFDWTGSENLAEARVQYPAPHRMIDKSGSAIGYKENVIFPVQLTAKDPLKPIVLKLKASYGACKELCVPAEVELGIAVPPDAEVSADLTGVIATVPHVTPSGSDPLLSAWRVGNRDGKPILILDVTDPAGAGGDAFVDAAGGVYLPVPKKISETAGKASYEVNLTDGADMKDLSGKSIAVTLVGSKGQSETSITLP
jgi:DsbC/DsbD-like thiol-disulfide interchange protein